MKRINSKYIDTGKKWINQGSLILNDQNLILDICSEAEADLKYNKVVFDTIESYREHLIMPGCVNSHSHAFQIFLRPTTGQPLNFHDWVERFLYPLVISLDQESIYASALLLFSEMLKHGITTVGEFLYLNNLKNNESSLGKNAEIVIQAAKDLGMRISLIRSLYDIQSKPGQKRFYEPAAEAIQATRSLAQKYKTDPLVSVLPAPHSLHGASRELIEQGFSLAKELGTPMHIHLAEQVSDLDFAKKKYGKTPVKTLYDWGVLDANTVLVHGIWLDPEEKELMGHTQAKLAYNPITNMALGDGIADIPALLKQGVSISLGTDANISSDLFAEARSLEYLQRTQKLAMGVIPNIRSLWQMLHLNGGINLGLKIGELKPCYQADFVAINLKDPSLLPAVFEDELEIPLLNQVIFSMTPSSAIESVYVQGEKVLSRGKLIKIDASEIYDLARRCFSARSNQGP